MALFESKMHVFSSIGKKVKVKLKKENLVMTPIKAK